MGRFASCHRPSGPRAAAVALVLLLPSLAGCAGGPMGPMGPGMPMFGDRPAVDGAPSPKADATEYVIVASEFAFAPNEIQIRPGQTVNIVLDNRGALYHDLTISDLDFALAADPAERRAGALTVLESGRYRFICSVPGHEAAGMSGTLIVGPAG
ncbi:MAG: cupredoxin domain-containing protein [Candidatus Limnocylindrales bacterium]